MANWPTWWKKDPAFWGPVIVAIQQAGPFWGSQCDPHFGPARKPLVHFSTTPACLFWPTLLLSGVEVATFC